ncbi:MAG: LysR family transcriptional regulator [Burkholderiales bacterium]|nr:LysR family transcriptional regulator [Burkholderiales bacterium]
MDRFSLMNAFVRIAETGSISAVARELGTTQPTVSKQLAALEATLGVTLLQRTTRRLSLTEAGGLFYESARRILDDLAEAEAGVARLSSGLAGTLTVAAPNALGQQFLDELLIAFQARHAGLKLHLIEGERFSDLVEEGIDVAVRVGNLDDSTLVARRLGSSRRVVVGTPEYFASHGVPHVPQDLDRHNCILYSYQPGRNLWPFQGPKGEFNVRVAGTFRTTSGSAIRRAVLAGIGVAAAPLWMVSDHLSAGRLQAVLVEFAPPPAAINAVYPSARQLSTKVRVLIDYLREQFAAVPDLN